MKKRLLAGLLLAGSTIFAGPRFSVGIGLGVPAAPAPVYGPAYIPPSPGPDYAWVAGYYGPAGVWVPGYWNYVAPVTVAPSFGFRANFHGDDHRGDFDHRDRDRDHRAPVEAHRGSDRGRR